MTTALKHRHFVVLASLVFALSILKGVRMPNLWSATHLTFNYSHGFIRRGLVGELLHLGFGTAILTYNRLALCAVALFAAAVVAIGLLVRRVLASDRDDLALRGAILAFAASPGLVVFTHLLGYLDDAGVVLLVAVILLGTRAKRPSAIALLTVPTGVVLALIHESLVLMFAPTLLFAMMCRIAHELRARPLDRRARVLMVVQAALAFLSTIASTSVVGLLGTKTAAEIRDLQASVARIVTFPLRGDAYETLYRPVRDNLTRVMPEFWRAPENQAYLIVGLLAAVPAIAFLIAYGVVLLGRLGLTTKARVLMTSAFVGATLAPITLNWLGWDSARWNAISLIDGFCCIAIVRLTFAPGSSSAARGSGAPGATANGDADLRVDSPVLLTCAAAAMILGLCSTSYDRFLFDGYTVQWFPFQGLWDALVDLFRGHFTFIPRA